jgi:hypothetical protein
MIELQKNKQHSEKNKSFQIIMEKIILKKFSDYEKQFNIKP